MGDVELGPFEEPFVASTLPRGLRRTVEETWLLVFPQSSFVVSADCGGNKRCESVTHSSGLNHFDFSSDDSFSRDSRYDFSFVSFVNGSCFVIIFPFDCFKPFFNSFKLSSDSFTSNSFDASSASDGSFVLGFAARALVPCTAAEGARREATVDIRAREGSAVLG